MNSQIQQFHNNEFGSLAILMLDGKPFFPATECAKILGYSNPQEAIRSHCKGVRKILTPTKNQYGATVNQSKNFMSEGDLYRLIIRSKLPAAERFERWVFDEVLPTIRKHGAYINEELLKEAEKTQEFAVMLFGNLLREQEKSEALRGEVKTLSPKAMYCDLVLQSDNAMPISIIAKDYGMTAVKFNRLLHHLGIQYKLGGAWLLYKEHDGKGYTKTRTYYRSDGVSVIFTCWTQMGRRFIYEILKSCGIVPLMEARSQCAVPGEIGEEAPYW